jgi:cobalt-zinc-cadmium efflux system outer membrane protein
MNIRIPLVLFLLSFTFALAGPFAEPVLAQDVPPPVTLLEELVAEALAKHPAIHAAAQRVAARRARVPQARALPDPQLMIGYMGRAVPFRTMKDDPSSARQFGVMQEIPYPGKRDLRGRIAAKDADAEQWMVEAERRRITAEVRAAYYELWAVDRTIEVTRRNRDLLGTFVRIAEERYKVGQGVQADVLRAALEVTRIRERLTLLEQRRRTQAAQINTLALRPHDTPVVTPVELPRAALVHSLEELVERATAEAPEVRRQDELIAQGQLAVNLAQREIRPDFAIGWEYQNRPGMPEMYGLRFQLNLPVFYKSKQRQAEQEAALDLVAAREQREAIRTTLLFLVKEQYLAARAAEELAELYERGMVPQAAFVLESSLAAFRSGTADFAYVLSGFQSVLDYESGYYQEIANHQKALARLEEITGLGIGSEVRR